MDIGNQLFDRIKAASGHHGIDPKVACQRALSEEILRGLGRNLGQQFLIIGPGIFQHPVRQAGNMEIVFDGLVSKHQLHWSLARMRAELAARGIELKSCSPTPTQTQIVTDEQLGHRYKISAQIGKATVTTDITVGYGKDRWPRLSPIKREGGVFYRGQQPLIGNFQAPEALAADKIVSGIMRPDAMTWPDYADLALLQGMDLDTGKVAAEVIYKLRQRFSSPEDIVKAIPRMPKALTWDHVVANAGKKDIENVLCSNRLLYSGVRETVAQSFEGYRGRARNVMPPELKARIEERVRSKRGDNVVDLSERRERVPGYRPKGI